MKNLEQIRAAHALEWEERCNPKSTPPTLTRADTSKLPAMILANGLLGALAFASEDEKPTRTGIRRAVDGTARHLAEAGTGFPELHGVSDSRSLLKQLASGDAITLQRATNEALAYISYLKRYAPRKDS